MPNVYLGSGTCRKNRTPNGTDDIISINYSSKEERVGFTISHYSVIVHTVLYVHERQFLVQFASTFDWEPGTNQGNVLSLV